MFKTIKIRSYEIGLYFLDGEFRGLLGAGRHWFLDPLGKVKIEVNQTYALADAASAHRDLEARKTTGSTVLLP